MGIVITRPLLKDGHLGGGLDWITGSPDPVVDGRMIQDNFQEIYNEINGRLHGSNTLKPTPTGDARIREDQVIFPETVWPLYAFAFSSAKGKVHSHNGTDSALLGMGAIQGFNANIKYRSFGIWQFPSCEGVFQHGATQVILFGSALVETVPTVSAALTFSLEVPYDKERWGNYVAKGSPGDSENDVGSYARPFVQIRCADANMDDVIKNPSAVISVSEFYPYIWVTANVSSPIEHPVGFYIDWVMPFLAERT